MKVNMMGFQKCTLLCATEDISYSNGEETIEIKTGDEVFIGVDGYLYPLDKEGIKLESENILEDEFSANGMAAYLIRWLNNHINLKDKLVDISIGEVETQMVKALLNSGMEVDISIRGENECWEEL